MAADSADTESLRRELSVLQERVEELAKGVGLLAPAVPAESQAVGLDVSRAAARVADEAAADAAVAARLRAELINPDLLAATRFVAVIRATNGQIVSWAQDGRLTPRSGAAAARHMGRMLSALGSEARLKLLLMLWHREMAAQELAEATGLTTGSLYHHMRELLAFRWVDAPQRNHYVLTERGRRALVVAWELTLASPPDPR